MDPTPERLVAQPANLPPGQTCQSLAAQPGRARHGGLRPQDFPCRPNNASFANMVSELGFAIAPNAFYPARTTGIGGFAVSIEASYTQHLRDPHGRDDDRRHATPYWHLGTQGAQDPNTKQFTIDQQLARLASSRSTRSRRARACRSASRSRAASATIANTSLWVGGGDLRWSLLEGFRTGALGLLPDVSVGGGVRTLTGTSKFYLTTVGST